MVAAQSMKSNKPILVLMASCLFGLAPLSALTISEISDVSPKVDEVPTPVRTTAPEYPMALKNAQVNGLVAVTVVIDESGAVVASEVTKSTNEGFNQSAVEAVQKWKFKPAKLAGKSVKVKVTIPVRFAVEE